MDGLAAIEPTNDQAWYIASGWKRILRCNDPVVNRWYSGALDYATTRSAGQAIAEGLMVSGRSEHLAVLRNAIRGDALPESARRGVLFGVHKGENLAFRAEIFLAVFRQDRFPQSNYFDLEKAHLLASDFGDEFMASAAEAVLAQPESSKASILWGILAWVAGDPSNDPRFSVSDNARRNLLRVIDQLKRHPALSEAMAGRGNGKWSSIGFERLIRERLAGGGLDR